MNTPTGHHIAHMNFARLLHTSGDPRVAGFVDNVPRVNAIAERSPGFIWRLVDDDQHSSEVVDNNSPDDDRLIITSLSVWQTVQDLEFFVRKTVHGGFVKRRAEWFEGHTRPNYVIWPVAVGYIPDLAEGWAKLKQLETRGPSDVAYDFHWIATKSSGK